MKAWFAVAVVLSGLILAWLLASMESCGRTYEIDARGRLVEGAAAAQGPGAAKVERTPLRWEEKLPEFADVAAHVRPGDRLDYAMTTAGYPVFALSMSALQVTRDGRKVFTVRNGALQFWSAVVGLSAFPLLGWGAAAFWSAVATGRPRPPTPG